MRLLILFLGLAASTGTWGAAPLDDDTARLARQSGCSLCHALDPVQRGGVPPSAPAWRDIAARYRNTRGAESKLVAVVMQGTKPGEQHWAGKVGLPEMPPNPVGISEGDARRIVRSILKLD